MSIAIPENLTKRIPINLALVITLTLACILFVLVPWLNETPERLLLGLLLVLFLPGYSLVVAFFPRRGDLDGTLKDRAQLWFGYRCCATDRSCTQLHAVRDLAGACASRAASVHDLACSGRVYAAGMDLRGGAVCGRGVGAGVWWRW